MVYYPSGHGDLLFGGYEQPIAGGGYEYMNDTWAFAHGVWTELISNTSCTSTTCPAGRAGAMMAYYAPLNAVLLFGGYKTVVISEIIVVTYAFSDTWLFYNGTWHNITATAGAPPSARFDGAMVWDSLDGYDLLFGGAQASGDVLSDTWTFDGTWSNITASEIPAPGSRAGAAIADSPSGYIMLYGGESGGVSLQDGCSSTDVVGWWFYQGVWSTMTKENTCIAGPAAPDPVTSEFPPCGRYDAALGWSPQNNRFVLYGGLGETSVGVSSCSGGDVYLNDTWIYENPPGNGFYWQNGGDSGDPPARAEMGYASDFSDGFFEIFGGVLGSNEALVNETWRFFEVVHAKLSGPGTINTNATMQLFSNSFTVVGYGGSGNLSYSFSTAGLRNSNPLNGPGDCGYFTNGTTRLLPYDGTVNLVCNPTQKSYNVFRLTLTVVDTLNSSDLARTSWVVTVLPPETAKIYSEYTEFFYHGFSLENTFSAYLNVANTSATKVSATIGGVPLTFNQRSGSPYWWDAPPLDMGSVTPGAEILLQGDFPGWTVNATYQTEIIDTPTWLSSLFSAAGATQTITTTGSGPYNKVFWINETFDWDISQALGFSIPVPLVGGSYSLIPDVKVTLSANSMGALALEGSFSLKTPDIDIGVFSLQLSASLNLTGKFALTGEGAAVSGIQWVGAQANLAVSGTFSGSVPIYGFDILGVTVGFTLDLSVSPSVGLDLLLGPASGSGMSIAQGIQVMLDQIFGNFTLPLSVSINFGIAIASVGIGGTLSVALEFSAYPSLGVVDGWVNGSLFVQASFLWWSDSWNLIGPGVIYSWDPPAVAAQPGTSRIGSAYNNGTGTAWTLESRYYDTSSYDSLVWNASSTGGPAVADIYPHTALGGAAGYNGAYVFYTNDNVSRSAPEGLTVSGVRLDGTSNRLTTLPSPSDPNYVIANPVATTLPDGSLYVVWAAVPDAETSDASPLNLTSIQLHGAQFDPATQSWGPVKTWVDWGLAESYQLDGRGSTPSLVALVTSTPLVGKTSPERLVEFDLTRGTEISNVSVSGISEVSSFQAGLGEAVVQLLNGNSSVVNLGAGTAVAVSPSVASNATLISESFVAGAPSALALLYRQPNASMVLLYDLASQTTIATLPVGVGTLSVEAVQGTGSIYLFARSASGISVWSEAGGAFQLIRSIPQAHTESFEVVQADSALVVVSLVTNGNATEPIVTLTLNEVPAALLGVPGQPSSASKSSSGLSTTQYLIILGIAAGVVAVLLAVVGLVHRRRPRAPGGSGEGTPAPGPTAESSSLPPPAAPPKEGPPPPWSE